MMFTILAFPSEMELVKRQTYNQWYHITMYYLSRLPVDLLSEASFTFFSSILIYYISGQPNDVHRYLVVWQWSYVLAIIGQTFGLIIGGVFTTMTAGIVVGDVVALVMALFSGFFVKISKIPYVMRWLSNVSVMRYPYEGVLLTIYGFGREPLVCEDETPFCIKDPTLALKALSCSSTITGNIVVMILYVIGARIAGAVILWLRIWCVRGNRHGRTCSQRYSKFKCYPVLYKYFRRILRYWFKRISSCLLKCISSRCCNRVLSFCFKTVPWLLKLIVWVSLALIPIGLLVGFIMALIHFPK